mmetsp:Transcript_63442/g.169686  ORF Transcript_63442/g.169686 Transcript_63442/m.169686 type:complete len:288 (-) Transcript_63442:546-1409(-)
MTCSIFSCCDGSQRSPASAPISSRQPKGKQRGVVLLLASSDVLHALKSKNINVFLIDVRTPEEYNASHIENAINFPYHGEFTPSVEDIVRDATLQNILKQVNTGALPNLLKKPDTDEAINSSIKLGGCLVVYDGCGDTKESIGPAASFTQFLVENDLVMEVSLAPRHAGLRPCVRSNPPVAGRAAGWGLRGLQGAQRLHCPRRPRQLMRHQLRRQGHPLLVRVLHRRRDQAKPGGDPPRAQPGPGAALELVAPQHAQLAVHHQHPAGSRARRSFGKATVPRQQEPRE